MKKSLKLTSLIVTLLLLFQLIGCTAEQPTSAPDPTPAAKEEEKSKDLPTFAVVANDTIGDRGFIDMSSEGIKKAADELGIEYKFFSCNNDTSIYLDTLKAAAESYDVIFVVPGYFFDKEIEETIKLYPDKTYIYIDGASPIVGVKSCTFKQNEGAFLAGVLAAHLTQDTSVKMINDKKVVGFLGGFDMPVIHDYQVGFEQGVKFADPTVECISRYTGDHYDPELGKVTAYNSYEEGADVIFQAAGPAGLGVLEAAAANNFIAIGVDTDQGYIQPNFVASSMLKRVDTAVYDMVTKICSGTPLDDISVYNVANGGISMADNEYYQNMVPKAIQDKVTEAQNKIISGEIVVESYNK
jgi:basic membrane protein A